MTAVEMDGSPASLVEIRRQQTVEDNPQGQFIVLVAVLSIKDVQILALLITSKLIRPKVCHPISAMPITALGLVVNLYVMVGALNLVPDGQVTEGSGLQISPVLFIAEQD